MRFHEIRLRVGVVEEANVEESQRKEDGVDASKGSVSGGETERNPPT
jgi:hypothetical protein